MSPRAAPPLQLRRKKRPRPNARLADALMGKAGVGAGTTSPVGAVAGAFLSQGLRGAMGSSGSLRNKLVGRAMGSAADRLTGEAPAAGRASLGGTIAGHFKEAMMDRLSSSDLGRAYGMAKGPFQAASRRRDIAERKAAGAPVAAARAARRAAAEEDDAPSPGGLFDEPTAAPVPASDGPPAPQIPAPPRREAVTLRPNPPLLPASVTTGLTAPERATGGEHDDEEKAE